MAKVSIVIPTYNVEKYIDKCLKSLLNQTLQDIEIICVDDCSTDSTVEILNRYKESDKRVRVIVSDINQGCSKMRNIGIENSTGEYVGFVDSDDWVDFDFYEKLYTKAKKTNAEVVKGAVYKNVFDNKHNMKTENNKFMFYSGFYSAIYKKDFLKNFNIFFSENVKTSEVPVFILKVVLNCKKIYVVPNAFYYYLNREDSKVRTFTDEKFISYLNGVKIMLEDINLCNLPKDIYIDCVENRIVLELFKRCYWANLDTQVLMQRYETTKKIIESNLLYDYSFDFEKYYKKIYNNIELNFLQKIFSIKNIKNIDCTKSKVLTIWGIKFELK